MTSDDRERGGDQLEELLSVYDDSLNVVGAMRRGELKSRGLAAGAVQLLLAGPHGRILLQRRREDKENGGLWDKSVGGHVLAGESFDDALLREANEELFGGAGAGRVAIVTDLMAPSAAAVRARSIRIERGLRDIRFSATPARELINASYHAAMYLGRTELEIEAFAPQPEELSGLDYFAPSDVDRMLVSGELAPNMAFLWFALGAAASRG